MIRAAPPAILLSALILSGCASAGTDDYPSLARRPVEQRAQVPPPPAEIPVPEPASAPLAQAIAALARDADRGESAFRAALADGRAQVAAGRGAATGVEAWAVAQLALSRMDVARGPTLMALAELDRLTLAQADAGDVAGAQALTAERDRVAALAGTQRAELDRMLAGLD